MSYTTPAAIEILMQSRLADRLNEAKQQRLADIASRQQHAMTSDRSARARTRMALRFLSSLV